jgi:hypothetical protein
MNPSYVQTVNLLLDIAPTVFQTPRFAMKGGTAQNFMAANWLLRWTDSIREIFSTF